MLTMFSHLQIKLNDRDKSVDPMRTWEFLFR
jgi:hypothetical protein